MLMYCFDLIISTGPIPAILCMALLVLGVLLAVLCQAHTLGAVPGIREAVVARDRDSALGITP
jgi:hypothetical protein